MNQRIIIGYLLIVFSILPLKVLSSSDQDLISIESLDYAEKLIQIEKTNGSLISVKALIADNKKKTTQGLMFVESMPDNVGMLFVFEPTRRVSMWMKNTPQSLDILFIQSDGTIINIEKNTTPYSLKSISSKGRIQWVLELTAGFTGNKGIRVGDKLIL